MRIVLLAGMLAWSGCQMARVPDPLTRTLAGNDDNAQFDFWYELNTRPRTSNDEAFHGLLLYLDDRDPASDYDGRVRVLKDRNLLPRSFDRPADEVVRRGTLAVAIARLLGVEGGVMMRLSRGHERYALLELEDMGLFPISSENQSFSGAEFIGIMGRVQDFRTGEAANTPAADLQGAGRPLPP